MKRFGNLIVLFLMKRPLLIVVKWHTLLRDSLMNTPSLWKCSYLMEKKRFPCHRNGPIQIGLSENFVRHTIHSKKEQLKLLFSGVNRSRTTPPRKFSSG